MTWRLCAFYVLLLVTFASDVLGRRRTSPGTFFDFSIIKNTTFPCEGDPDPAGNSRIPMGILDMQALREAPRYNMTAGDLEALLTSKGGRFLPKYMARDEEEASHNFHSMLPLSFTSQDATPTFGRVFSRLPKEKFISWLREQRNLPKDASPHLPREDMEVKKETSSDEQQSPELYSYLDFILPEDMPGETTFVSQPNDGQCEIDMCLPRKTLLPDLHYTMCTTCSVICQLDPLKFWPYIFNGATCSEDDNQCMFYEGFGQGLCRTKPIAISILEKQDGHCELALKDGGIVIVDRYKITSHTISTSCECTIYRDSIFAGFL